MSSAFGSFGFRECMLIFQTTLGIFSFAMSSRGIVALQEWRS
jgi:hypothetical protein